MQVCNCAPPCLRGSSFRPCYSTTILLLLLLLLLLLALAQVSAQGRNRKSSGERSQLTVSSIAPIKSSLDLEVELEASSIRSAGIQTPKLTFSFTLFWTCRLALLLTVLSFRSSFRTYCLALLLAALSLGSLPPCCTVPSFCLTCCCTDFFLATCCPPSLTTCCTALVPLLCRSLLAARIEAGGDTDDE